MSIENWIGVAKDLQSLIELIPMIFNDRTQQNEDPIYTIGGIDFRNYPDGIWLRNGTDNPLNISFISSAISGNSSAGTYSQTSTIYGQSMWESLTDMGVDLSNYGSGSIYISPNGPIPGAYRKAKGSNPLPYAVSFAIGSIATATSLRILGDFSCGFRKNQSDFPEFYVNNSGGSQFTADVSMKDASGGSFQARLASNPKPVSGASIDKNVPDPSTASVTIPSGLDFSSYAKDLVIIIDVDGDTYDKIYKKNSKRQS